MSTTAPLAPQLAALGIKGRVIGPREHLEFDPPQRGDSSLAAMAIAMTIGARLSPWAPAELRAEQPFPTEASPFSIGAAVGKTPLAEKHGYYLDALDGHWDRVRVWAEEPGIKLLAGAPVAVPVPGERGDHAIGLAMRPGDMAVLGTSPKEVRLCLQLSTSVGGKACLTSWLLAPEVELAPWGWVTARTPAWVLDALADAEEDPGGPVLAAGLILRFGDDDADLATLLSVTGDPMANRAATWWASLPTVSRESLELSARILAQETRLAAEHLAERLAAGGKDADWDRDLVEVLLYRDMLRSQQAMLRAVKRAGPLLGHLETGDAVLMPLVRGPGRRAPERSAWLSRVASLEPEAWWTGGASAG